MATSNGGKNAYRTTYTREFKAPAGPAAHTHRPGSTRAFQASYELAGRIGDSTYDTVFSYKGPQTKAQPIRTGTASGNRRNNPHPLTTFMNWRLPPKMTAREFYKSSGQKLTEDHLDKVFRGQLNSTYQTDYLGIQQGVPVKTVSDVPEQWRSKVPYTLDSSTRYSYQQPRQHPELKGNLTRYGCNKTKHKSADAIVPTVSNDSVQSHVKVRTTYEREFKDTHYEPLEVRDLAKSMGAQALLNYLNQANPKDNKVLERMLKTMGGAGSSTVYKRAVPPATQITGPQVSYVSTWVGPM